MHFLVLILVIGKAFFLKSTPTQKFAGQLDPKKTLFITTQTPLQKGLRLVLGSEEKFGSLEYGLIPIFRPGFTQAEVYFFFFSFLFFFIFFFFLIIISFFFLFS